MATMAPAVLSAEEAFAAELVEQRERLLRLLSAQRAQAAILWAWYHGRQPAPAIERRYRADFRLLLEISRTPWARLVVDTIAERLQVQGFRAGAGGLAQAEAAWGLWGQSAMDADERLVYTQALIAGVGYVSVAKPDAVVRIAPESAFEVTHEPVLGNFREVAAAIKLFPLDWSGLAWGLELYRPEATYRWEALLERRLGELDDLSVAPIDAAGGSQVRLDWVEGEPFRLPNALGVVPIVPFENRATVLGGGVSEFRDCLALLSRIDKLTFDLSMASEFGSFRQKWATGMEVPRDEAGNPIEPFRAAVSRLWISENADTRFGSFEATDLTSNLRAIDAAIASLAAISRVPAHYLMQSNLANPPSAESLVAAESGLVAKVRERQARFGEAWGRALSMALALDGAGGADLEVAWADAEMRNPAQVADAALKLQAIGVPQRALWEYVGASPQQLNEWTIESAGAELAAAAAAGSGGPG